MKKINISTGEIMGKMCTGIYVTEDYLIINQGNYHDKVVLYICEMGLLKKTPNKNNYCS